MTRGRAPRALYIRPGTRGMPMNARFEALIRECFPAFEIDVLDLERVLPRHLFALARNALETRRLYTNDLRAGRKRFDNAFLRTPGFMALARRIIAKRVTAGRYDFTLQIQSLFDGSTGVTPHFVWTDHVHLAHLRADGVTEADLYHPDWIRLERGIYENATRTLLRSADMAAVLGSAYGLGGERVAVVGCGPTIRPPATPAPDPATPSILFLGRAWHRKGGPDVLRAFRQVRRRVPDATLDIVGCSPEVPSDLEGVRVHGLAPIEAIAEHIGRRAVFCMPTTREPFSVATLDAMACGRPIVSTTVPGMDEQVLDGETGFLIAPGDADALADRLTRLVSSPELRSRMGAAGRARFEREFAWPVVFERFRAAVRPHLAGAGAEALG